MLVPRIAINGRSGFHSAGVNETGHGVSGGAVYNIAGAAVGSLRLRLGADRAEGLKASSPARKTITTTPPLSEHRTVRKIEVVTKPWLARFDRSADRDPDPVRLAHLREEPAEVADYAQLPRPRASTTRGRWSTRSTC